MYAVLFKFKGVKTRTPKETKQHNKTVFQKRGAKIPVVAYVTCCYSFNIHTNTSVDVHMLLFINTRLHQSTSDIHISLYRNIYTLSYVVILWRQRKKEEETVIRNKESKICYKKTLTINWLISLFRIEQFEKAVELFFKNVVMIIGMKWGIIIMFDRIIRTCRHIPKYKTFSWFVTTVCRIPSDLFTFVNWNNICITSSLYSTDLFPLL